MNRVVAFGLVIREHRLRNGLSQEALAEAAGLHRNFISLIERGQTKAALDTIFALADALGVTGSALLLETEEGAPRPRTKVRAKP